MFNAMPNPILDPIGYLASVFLNGLMIGDFSTFLILIVFGSVITFPMALFGQQVFKRIDKKINYLVRVLGTTFVIVSIFFIVFGAWRALFGLGFYAITDLVMNMMLGTAFSFCIVMLCGYINRKKFLDIPDKLYTYLLCVIGNTIAWFILWMLFIILWKIG